MKVLLLAPVPPPDHGGIINWTRLVITGFAKQPGYQLRFVDSARRYEIVPTVPPLRRAVFGSWQALRDSFGVLRQFRGFRPDVFHLCTSGGLAALKDAILASVARQFKIPVAVHYRMGRLPRILASKTLESLLIRYVLLASSAVLVLGAASEEAVRAAAPEQYVVNLPNMVDMGEIDSARVATVPKPEGKDLWNITFVGYVIPDKGVEELVRACAAFGGERLELHLVGVYSTTYREVLENIAYSRNGDRRWLRFHGPVHHAEALRHIARCDMFVLPSYSEGAPNVILEAMAMGKPILATSVGAIPEMLAVDSAEPCGVCVAPRSTDAVRKEIEDFLQDPLKWHQLGDSARRRAERTYSLPVGCGHLATLWRDISRGQKRIGVGPSMADLVTRIAGTGRALHVSRSGELYASRGYDVFCSTDGGLTWRLDVSIQKGSFKAFLAGHRRPARLLRYDVAAFAVLSNGTRVAVARDGIYRAATGKVRMDRVFRITRGSRPLNITIDGENRILFGEYGDLPRGSEICIYASEDDGKTFHVAYTFGADDIRHVHNVVWDRWDGGYWVMVGDFDRQPGIGKLSADFRTLEWVRRGSQMFRAVGGIVEADYLYYGTDSELAQNYIIRLDKRSGAITRLRPVEGSSLYATRFGDLRLIATCVEHSRVNHSRQSVLYASTSGDIWQPVQAFQKDSMNPKFFQFGTVVLPSSSYPKPVGMFSGQALTRCDNRLALIRLESAETSWYGP